MHKLRILELIWDNLKDNLLYVLSLKLSHNYMTLYETTYEINSEKVNKNAQPS